MRRTKRWLLIFAALVGLMAHAGALRATALIFGKVPTSTTTTTEAPVEPEEEVQTTEVPLGENNTSTKATLTGIPQIDYIWDPNLPRELNGYNLSDYPFYNSVPPMEEIDFKCDGLHDGFYASVKHKCQLYHHCLFGIRYDFLCANFTAFDQKTFICHFVSEVDCKNSPKYYHRNDALYQAPTSSSTTTTTTTTTAPPPTAPVIPQSAPGIRPRPGHPRRRPLRRRRPQVDYYYYDEDYDDDYYEERRNRRRKQRPRKRRPDYDDEYEDRRGYDDEDRYEKRPYNRDRGRDEGEDYDYDRRKPDRPRSRNRPGDNRRFNEDDRSDRNKYAERRRPNDDRRVPSEERRPVNNDRRNLDERRSFNDNRHFSKERNQSDDDEDLNVRPGRKHLNGDRRPIYDDDDRRGNEDRPLKREKEDDERPLAENDKTTSKPAGPGGLSSLFGPRPPPKIARPVPNTERKKFEYTTKKPPTPATSDDEYYDEYEDEPPKSQQNKEEKQGKVNTSFPKRTFSTPVKVDQRTRYETVRETEEKEQEKSSPNVSIFSAREQSRRPYFTKAHEESRSRQESVRDNEDRKEKASAKPNNNPRETVKRPYSNFEREESRPRLQEDTVDEKNIDHVERSTQKPKYRPITRTQFRGPLKKEILPEEDEDVEYKDRLREPPKVVSAIRFGTSRGGRVEEKENESETKPENVSESSTFTSEQTEEKNLNTENEKNLNEEVDKPVNDETPVRENRPKVRIVKRPFLPSRGGSPYLPRGLQPVGIAQKSPVTESTPIDMGSTVSGVRLLEHAAPLVRSSFNSNDEDYPQPHQGPRTTQQPQIDPPKSSLDEIYDNEYDVTLNDALNPTLKPLTANRGYPSGFSHINKFENGRFPPSVEYNPNSDSFYSSSDVRSSAVRAPVDSKTQPSSSRQTHEYYDDEYEY